MRWDEHHPREKSFQEHAGTPAAKNCQSRAKPSLAHTTLAFLWPYSLLDVVIHRTGIISPTQRKQNSTEYSEHQSQQNTKETSCNKLQRTLTPTKNECSPYFQITKDTNPNILHKTLSQKR